MLEASAIARRVTGLVLLGAASTVAVAWACGAWGNLGRQPLQKHVVHKGRVVWILDAKSRFGAERHRWWAHGIADDARERATALHQSIESDADLAAAKRSPFGYVMYRRWPPSWGAFPKLPSDGVDALWMSCEDARGWPLLALHAELKEMWPVSREGPSAWRGGIGLPNYDTWPDVIDMPRALPYLPIWSGFIGDTLFYAAVWAALIFVPGFVRGRRRIRRGLCQRCAYDLRGLTTLGCPECGWRRESHEKTGASAKV